LGPFRMTTGRMFKESRVVIEERHGSVLLPLGPARSGRLAAIIVDKSSEFCVRRRCGMAVCEAAKLENGGHARYSR
jgi:hypothetical protein